MPAAMLNRVVRIAVLLCVGMTAALAFLGLALTLVKLDTRADRNATWSQADRLYGFQALTPRLRSHRRVIELALATMPQDATYRVVIGKRWQPLWDVDWQGARGSDVEVDFLRYFLLPRRETDSSARWVFCLGCDRVTVASGFRVLAASPDGFAFASAAR